MGLLRLSDMFTFDFIFPYLSQLTNSFMSYRHWHVILKPLLKLLMRIQGGCFPQCWLECLRVILHLGLIKLAWLLLQLLLTKCVVYFISTTLTPLSNICILMKSNEKRCDRRTDDFKFKISMEIVLMGGACERWMFKKTTFNILQVALKDIILSRL